MPEPPPSSPDPNLQSQASDRLTDDIALVLGELHDPVLFIGWDWQITYYNQNAARVSHLRPEDLNGPTTWELFPEIVGTELESKYRHTMAERVEQHHLLFHEPLGAWLDIRIVPIQSGVAILYRDVTIERREIQQRRAVSDRLEQLLDVTTDAILYLDRQYNITFLNRRARQLLAPSGNVIGTNLWESFPTAFYEGSPYVENYHRSMDLGLPGQFESYYPAPLNLWLSVKSLPAGDGIIVFFRDITEERADKEALRAKQVEAERQRAEIETVYRTAPVGLALFDPVEFRYLRLNDRQAEFFGLLPENILGKTVTEMAPIPGLQEMFEQVARGEPVRDQLLEGELTTRPGEHRYWTVNYHPVFAGDGTVQAISAVSLEITRQKQAEAALIQSEKLAAVGRLATSISHEINNPLEAITNILYLMAMHEELTPALRAYVEVAQGELARVSQIATQTLRFHRQSFKPTRVTAQQLVGPVIDLYQGRLANSGVEVQASYATEKPFLCFENDIRQVLNNLIANALDAMRVSGGRLIIRAHEGRDHVSGRLGVRISIADTGLGMSPEVQARVFEPFYTTKDLNGTGLGLWISCEIMNRHRGRITLRSSQAPAHRGTTFTLFLPFEDGRATG